MSEKMHGRIWMGVGVLSSLILGLSLPARGAVVIMDPTHYNGSFEDPVGNDHDVVTFPDWSGGTFSIRKPGYLVGATDGSQSINVANLVAWQSDVMTTHVPAGSTVSLSVDFGWDSWVNATPAQASTVYLLAVDPTNFNNTVTLLSFTDQADYNGFGTDAGWHTFSGSALVQNVNDGWYLQVLNASGGYANQMFDNYVVTSSQAAPEPAACGLLALAGISAFRRRRIA